MALGLLVVTCWARAAAAGGLITLRTLTEIPVTTSGSQPFGITTGPSGNIWFTEAAANQIARLDSDLKITEFPIRTPPGESAIDPSAITLGPDGNLWFIESEGSSIGRIMPQGEVTEFPLPTAGATALRITGGPDGNVWFTETMFFTPLRSMDGSGGHVQHTESSVSDGFGARIGRITPNGTISEFDVPEADFGFLAGDITRGPDGNLWFTATPPLLATAQRTVMRGVIVQERGLIGRVTTSGAITTFPISGQPVALTAGPDDALWFTNNGDYAVGRFTTDGMLGTFVSPNPLNVGFAIVRGPEDNLWYTGLDMGIYVINRAGSIELVPNTAPLSVSDLTVGLDGAIWFTESDANKIGRLETLAYEFITLTGGGAPMGLAQGADGSVWFADAGGNRVGRVSASGSLLQVELGDGHTPTGITVAADGAAWFTNVENNSIGHVTLAGDVTTFAINPPNAAPQDIVLGPDGNFWFTEFARGAIGRITPQGVIREFPTQAAASGSQDVAVGPVTGPQGIAAGADGNLWFTDRIANKIGRITPAGMIDEFPIPTADSEPWGIAAGPDGNLYFVEHRAGRVARVTTNGVVTELGTPVSTSFPQCITLAPDGAMWFTENGANRLGRVAADGRITKFNLPVTDSGPTGIAGRSDGSLWYGLFNIGEVGHVQLFAAEPTHTVTPTPSVTATPSPERIDTPTATPSAATTTTPLSSTDTPTPNETISPTPSQPPTPMFSATPPACAGDCNGNGHITIDELLTAVSRALGYTDATVCQAVDADRNEIVRVGEIIRAVRNAFTDCR